MTVSPVAIGARPPSTPPGLPTSCTAREWVAALSHLQLQEGCATGPTVCYSRCESPVDLWIHSSECGESPEKTHNLL